MGVSVSALSYVGPKMRFMAELPKEFGIEIFWDWGSEDYYNGLLPKLMKDRQGVFSIHGPMICEDFSDPDADGGLFDRLKRPFDLYHRFDSKFYVLHTNGKLPPDLTETQLTDRRKLAAERIYSFEEQCRANGVLLVIENVGAGPNGVGLFDQTEFVRLFDENEHLYCLVDTGHTLIGGLDLAAVQQKLSGRIKAYHINDNDGTTDQHLRAGEGLCDWDAWRKNFFALTTDAEVVFEYSGKPNAEVYRLDAEKLGLTNIG